MKKLRPLSRILIAISALALIATYYLPIWRIELDAPQYPEGLYMQIWLYKLSGDVEIINGLNHYIGMAHIKAEMFPEFTFLVYVVAFYIALGLLTALMARKSLLTVYLSLMILGGIAALVDFYRWGYQYGHNLDPNAAIQVPGMAYQPPLIGFKQLLNFGAFSIPDTGGWVIVGVGSLVLAIWLCELFFCKVKTIKPLATATVMILGLGFFSACTAQPEPIKFGKDNCHHCKMTLMDTKFGAEVLTKKGKVYKFDDVNCLVNFLNTNELKQADIAQILVVDFKKTKELIPVEKLFFLNSSKLRTPMSSDIAAFGNKKDLTETQNQFKGEKLNWEAVKKLFE
ncbi:MAG: nitrous oxide reductase accessory protein NosL [Microscillaceae bacterium]|jgi:copper chaperone NosL|nr:nitrous oxide reductase accessory protein NosL [Microscillaceae bacterium]